MSASEKLEVATLNLLTEEFYVVEEAKPGLTDEQITELLDWHA